MVIFGRKKANLATLIDTDNNEGEQCYGNSDIIYSNILSMRALGIQKILKFCMGLSDKQNIFLFNDHQQSR